MSQEIGERLTNCTSAFLDPSRSLRSARTRAGVALGSLPQEMIVMNSIRVCSFVVRRSRWGRR